LGVSDLRNDHPYCEAWLDVAVQAGHARTDDFNGAQSDGMGRYQLTLRGHWRCDAATAFLRPAPVGSFGVVSQNAFETQSLLQLKNEYCNKSRCLECAIGMELLKSS
jgi:choline dehydrogenase-like flavoprotein